MRPNTTTEVRRLALFLPDLGGGGAERVALTLIEGFIARGYEVDLVLGSKTGSLVSLIPTGATVFDLGSPRLRNAVTALARYLKERRPHALHAMMWPAPIIAIVARALARVDTRIIGSEHTTLSMVPQGLKHRAIRALTRLAYLKADALIAVSHGVADDMSEFIGLPRDRIGVIYNPLQLPATLPATDMMARRWPAGTRRLLAVGELKAEKNYPLLLRALGRLRAEMPVSLLILGDGSLFAEIEQQVAAAGLQDIVVMAGFHNDIWPYYVAADLFILSSDIEGFGNVLVEAMYAGISVISTECPSGPVEILDKGRFGTLVPCNDDVALARAIADALARKPDTVALRARAIELSGIDAIDRHVTVMLGRPSVH